MPFESPLIRQYAREIASDELAHVKLLRGALRAAGVNFLIGAFIFEDVGVTAYKGAARLPASKDILEAAAGLLAVEAYHASEIRATLLSLDFLNPSAGIADIVRKISKLRDALDGPKDLDQPYGETAGRTSFQQTKTALPSAAPLGRCSTSYTVRRAHRAASSSRGE